MDIERPIRGVIGTTVVMAAMVVASAEAASLPPRAPAMITQAQSGKTYRVTRGTPLTLRLSSPWVWTEPKPTPRRVELTPVEYFVDPGFSEWKLDPLARGTVKITSTGTPACEPCGLATRRFVVTLRIL